MVSGTFDEKNYKSINFEMIVKNLKNLEKKESEENVTRKVFDEIVYRDDNTEFVISYWTDNNYLNLKEIIDIISENMIYDKINKINITYHSHQLPYSEFFRHLLEQTPAENKYAAANKINQKIESLKKENEYAEYQQIKVIKNDKEQEINSKKQQLDKIYQKLAESAYKLNPEPDNLNISYHEPYNGHYIIELINNLDSYKKSEDFNHSTKEIIDRMSYETPSFEIIVNRDRKCGYTIDLKIYKDKFLKRKLKPDEMIAKLNNILNSFGTSATDVYYLIG